MFKSLLRPRHCAFILVCLAIVVGISVSTPTHRILVNEIPAGTPLENYTQSVCELEDEPELED